MTQPNQADRDALVARLRKFSEYLWKHSLLPNEAEIVAEAATALTALSAEVARLTEERDEALKFARSEATRNGSVQYEIDRYKGRENRDYGAAMKVRQMMMDNGYSNGSYLGVYDHSGRRHERVGDTKYTPPVEILEQFVTHLLTRAALKDQAFANFEATLPAQPHRECARCCGNGQTYGPNSGDDIICPDCQGRGNLPTEQPDADLLAERDALEDELKGEIVRAYCAGALAVHENWQEDRDPDFTEAAYDYFHTRQALGGTDDK